MKLSVGQEYVVQSSITLAGKVIDPGTVLEITNAPSSQEDRRPVSLSPKGNDREVTIQPDDFESILPLLTMRTNEAATLAAQTQES